MNVSQNSADPRPLRFYVDPLWRRTDLPHSVFLFPFWGSLPAHDTVLLREMLFEKRGFDTSLYAVTDKKDEADLVFMPYSHKMVRRWYPELLTKCSAVAEELGVPLLVDGVEDVPYKVETPNTFVLRYGGYRFEQNDRDIIIPPFANDMLELHCGGELRIREKTEGKPIVGFAGWGKLAPYQALRSTLKGLPDRLHGLFDSRFSAKKKGTFFRAEAMRVLQRSPLITCNFIVRESYSGHRGTAVKSIEELQKDFVDNLLESDYGLDVRGDANASTRLFEMLSLGRIPVIVDTERNFPFSDKVDYASFALIVDFRDLKQLPERIAEFHKHISPERFVEMQRNAREAYVNYFRVDALMRPLTEELRARML